MENKSLEYQKRFCVKYSNLINIDIRKKVLQILTLKVPSEIISEHADGTRILLDNITDKTVINDIYNFIKNSL